MFKKKINEWKRSKLSKQTQQINNVDKIESSNTKATNNNQLLKQAVTNIHSNNTYHNNHHKNIISHPNSRRNFSEKTISDSETNSKINSEFKNRLDMSHVKDFQSNKLSAKVNFSPGKQEFKYSNFLIAPNAQYLNKSISRYQNATNSNVSFKMNQMSPEKENFQKPHSIYDKNTLSQCFNNVYYAMEKTVHPKKSSISVRKRMQETRKQNEAFSTLL